MTFSSNFCRRWRFTPPGEEGKQRTLLDLTPHSSLPRLWEPEPQHCGWSNLLHLVCALWDPLEPHTPERNWAADAVGSSALRPSPRGGVSLAGKQYGQVRLTLKFRKEKTERALSGIWDPLTNKDSLPSYLAKKAIILRNNWKQINLVYDSPMRCQITLFIN